MNATGPHSLKSETDDPLRSKRSAVITISTLVGIAASYSLASVLGVRANAGLLTGVVVASLSAACYLGWRHRSDRLKTLERAHNDQMQAGLFDTDTGTFGPKYVEFGYNNEMTRAYRHHAPMTLISAAFDYERVARIHGPAAAEHLVQVLAQILKSALRGSDVICRKELGEFVVLLPETDMRQAEIPRQRVMRATEQWNLNTRVKYRLSARVGLGDCWDGLEIAVRDARLVCGMTPVPPPFPETGYLPGPVVVN